MGVKYFCYQLKNAKKYTGYSLLKSLLLLVMLSAAVPAMALDVAPVFTNGSPQYLSVCKNSGGVSIDYLLTINAIATGNTETWSVAVAPAAGTLTGFNTSDTTTGSPLTPSGQLYIPATGYTGTDSFIIQVSDGTNSTTTTVYVTVHALPSLTSTLTPPAICDGTTFSYTPASSVSGASFAWSRPAESGISTPASSGTGSISEVLSNSTYYDITATYIYTVTASGCSGTADVAVVVKPTPRLSTSITSDTICSGSVFNYTVASLTAGTSITWSRAAVAGISPAVSSGTGSISDTLTNSTATAQNVTYVFFLTAAGCSASRDVTVSVEPPVPVTAITTASPATVCTNTLYQNFGTATAPGSGVVYTWSAENADIYAQGANNQYILVNFNNPGYAYVTLTANVPGSACTSAATYSVNVGSATAASAGVIYNGGQFVYLDNTASYYQWGYDNISSLDSTAVAGANYQSYPDSTPDFATNYYWVITNEGGCMEKTYYNSPLALTNVQAANTESLKVYPNPATNMVNVAISGQGSATILLTDMMGRTLQTTTGSQQLMQFNVAGMPAGCYLFTCYRNGMKAGTARFIKN